MMLRFTVFLMFISCNLWASTEKGNGGDAIVCRDTEGKITKAELFDYYEGRLIYKQDPDLDGLSTTPFEYLVQSALSRLRKIDSVLAEKYQARSKTILGEVDFIPNIILEDIKDTGTIYIPEGCKIEQVAIRRKAEIVGPGEKRFIVSKDIWDKFSELHKAGLILHEIIYEHFSPDYGIPSQDIPVVVQNNSIKVRHFNYMLSLASFKLWSVADYVYFTKRLGVQLWYVANYYINNNYQNIAFDLTYDISFHENGVVAEGVLAKEYWPQIEWNLAIKPKSFIKLYPSGIIKEIRGTYMNAILINEGRFELCGFISIPTLFSSGGALQQATICSNKMKFINYFKGKTHIPDGPELHLFGAVEFGLGMKVKSIGVALDRTIEVESETNRMLKLNCTEEEKINNYCAYQIYIGKTGRAEKIEKRIYTPTVN